MDFVYDLVVVLHLLGMAALVGGWFAFTRGVASTEVMTWGARAQIVTGLVLVGLAEGVDSLDKHVNNPKIGVKLVVAIAAVACLEIARGRGRKGADTKTLVQAAGALGVLNVLVAALWQ
ncbi:MAG TPA: hypothetical protein VGK60_05175 [Pedococcus sp.]|jgi:hypothetical protein